MQYTIYIERDQAPDPKKYPNGIAWRSGVIDTATGEEIDGEGDIATYEEAKLLLLNAIATRLAFSGRGTCLDCGKTFIPSKNNHVTCNECNQ